MVSFQISSHLLKKTDNIRDFEESRQGLPLPEDWVTGVGSYYDLDQTQRKTYKLL